MVSKKMDDQLNNLLLDIVLTYVSVKSSEKGKKRETDCYKSALVGKLIMEVIPNSS